MDGKANYIIGFSKLNYEKFSRNFTHAVRNHAMRKIRNNFKLRFTLTVNGQFLKSRH
jgi:hypothetical protein